MRTKKSIYNIIITAVYYLQTTIIGLFLRRVFLSSLGLDYVGLDTVFANILSFLALLELGIGPAITYRLYKPLSENDTHEIACLMAVYKRFYRIVAAAICIIGIIVSFFITTIIKEAPIEPSRLILCYYLYLSSTVASYLLAYKRSLLVADQKQYLTVFVDLLVNFVVFVIKVVILRTTRNYVLILVINTIRVIISNTIIALVCNHSYGNLEHDKPLSKDEVKQKSKGMLPDISYILLHKTCNYVYSSTDGIVISTFMGVANVGLLANYNMIVSVISNLFMQCSSSIQSSIGNLVNSLDGGITAVKMMLDRLSFLYFIILTFCTCALFCLLSPFVTLWLGSEFLISQSIVVVICLNLFIYSFYQPIANLYTVLGLFKGDKITSPLAAITNIIVSISLVNSFGLIGVYVGTILGSLIYIIGRTIIVFRHYFFESPLMYLIKLLKYTVIAGIEVGVAYWCVNCLGDGLIEFVAKMAICVVLPGSINLLCFHKTDEFRYFKALFRRVVKKGL